MGSESIHHSLDINFATKSKYDEMMYILDLSYKYLPHQLKACFLYLGSYPEDHDIKKVDLVRRWVAEGFVSNSEGQDVWDVAESYYNELVNRSLIQPKYDENIFDPPPIPSCRVHDMLLELIVRRCKEDNFLSLINDVPDDMPRGQDKVIRRLTVVGFGGTVGNVPHQIRSLAMLGSHWMPPLLELKFVRVLYLDLPQAEGGNKDIDLTNINRLSQLRYLLVTSRSSRHIVLPHQIKGLRFLETLDFSRISIRGVAFQIDDAPHLSHLEVRRRKRLPNRIGRFKLLHTLRGFILPPMRSLENITGLGELAGLSDLEFYCPKRCAPLVEAAWMAALAASLEKLHNLRRLVMTCLFDVGYRADALSSLSPPFHNLERLDLRDWTFSRVPKWIGHRHNLRELRIGAKQILREDVVIMGTQLPRLLVLRLRILGIPMARIVVGGSTGFPALKRFIFDCDMVSYLTFEAGAMPELRVLDLDVYVDEWDRAAPGGLQHLPRLEKIQASTAFSSFEEAHRRSTEQDEALIRGVFQGAADSLPTRPAFKLWGGWIRSAYKGVIESVLAKLKDLTAGDMCSSFIGVSSGDVLFLRDELPFATETTQKRRARTRQC
ncbi:hypothetical protein U9M48_041297 [Paspalum notatum var. saurae]|uniref:NB-ARC domain-containing protein n=1 Tax=Paspalum notatum var. saurae TaxID=547442 RepID=A0AAQ3XE20_PASNO